MFSHAVLVTRIVLRIDEIGLAPGFVREVVAAWEAWEGKEDAPLKLKPKIPVYTDTRLT